MEQGSDGLRGRKKARTRTAIIDAATELFAQKGYDATTVEEIALAADVSPATVFRYFGAKEDLVFTEVAAVGLVASAIAERPSEESDLQAVAQALQPILGHAGFGRERLRVLRQAIAKSTVLQGRGSMMLQAWRDAIADGLARRHGVRPNDPSMRLRAALVMNGFEVATDEMIAGRHSDLGSALLAAICELEAIVRDWAPPAVPSRRS